MEGWLKEFGLFTGGKLQEGLQEWDDKDRDEKYGKFGTVSG